MKRLVSPIVWLLWLILALLEAAAADLFARADDDREDDAEWRQG